MASEFTLVNSAGETVHITGDSFNKGAIGEFAYFAGTTAQVGYLVCDGSEVSQTAYPELYAYIGSLWGTASAGKFRLPNQKKDGKGYFLRGVGGETVGTYQDDIIKEHKHELGDKANLYNASPANTSGVSAFNIGGYAESYFNGKGAGLNPLETRPMSITGLLCIRAFSTVASTKGVSVQGLMNEIQDLKSRVVVLEGHH